MTVDEALERIADVWSGSADEDAARDTLTALVTAATERGRAEGVAACVAYVDERGMGYINASNKPENDHASVRLHKAGEALRSVARQLRDDGSGADALARLLAAHGREVLEETAQAWRDEAGCLPIGAAHHGGALLNAPRFDVLMFAVRKVEERAAALRGKEGTTGSTGESEGA